MKSAGKKKASILAVDIDHDTLRLGVIAPMKNEYEAEFHEEPLEGAVLATGELSNDGANIISQSLARWFAEHSAPLMRVYMTAQDQQTTLSQQSFPPIKGKALQNVVKAKAVDTLRGIDEDNLRFGFVETHRTDSGVDGILATAKRHALEPYANILRELEGTVLRMEPYVFSLVNLVRHHGLPEEMNDRLLLIAHVTYGRINLAVLHEGELLFARLGSAGENMVRQRDAYDLLTAEINATLESYRSRSSQPPLALFTGRMSQSELARAAVENADVEILPGLSALGIQVNGQGAPDRFAALLGLASWEAKG